MANNPRDLVFISYHPRDRLWLERLEVHLKPLMQQGALSHWSNAEVHPGDDLGVAADRALSRACVLVLLVSADYLASSDFELMLKSKHDYNTMTLWLPVRPSAYDATELAGIEPLIDAKRPLAILSGEEAEVKLVRACQFITAAVTSAATDITMNKSVSVDLQPERSRPEQPTPSIAGRGYGLNIWGPCVIVLMLLLVVGLRQIGSNLNFPARSEKRKDLRSDLGAALHKDQSVVHTQSLPAVDGAARIGSDDMDASLRKTPAPQLSNKNYPSRPSEDGSSIMIENKGSGPIIIGSGTKLQQYYISGQQRSLQP